MKWHPVLLCGLALATPAGATTLLFDFGSNARQTLAPGWNNVVHDNGDTSPPLLVVVDSVGVAVPGVTLVETDPFYIVGQPSQGGTVFPAGAAAGFPVDATNDYYFGHTGPFGGGADNPSGGFKLTGLDQSLAFAFTFFSSRTGVNDNRQTAYRVNGANGGSGAAPTSNNDTEVLTINGILPDTHGEISVTVTAGPSNDNGNGFYYINLMQVDFVPEPSTAMLLVSAAGVAVLRRRRS